MCVEICSAVGQDDRTNQILKTIILLRISKDCLLITKEIKVDIYFSVEDTLLCILENSTEKLLALAYMPTYDLFL